MNNAPYPEPPSDESEARSRLISVRDVVEHELAALESLDDDRLQTVLRSMNVLRADLDTALLDQGAASDTKAAR